MEKNKTEETKTEATPPKSTVKPKSSASKEVVFPVEKLLQLEEFKSYHTSFIRALLPKASYTKKEACIIVRNYFIKKGGGK